ncbi:MAG: hypothetical protein LC627_05335 [Verrucomicrobiaceae bacterium]|nr:hypothetical protein [Verrucomicrobiaceae bacterium]
MIRAMRTSGTFSEILKTDSGVKENYQHAPKRATPGEAIQVNGAVLKWYRLHPEDQPVPEEIERLARAYLARTWVSEPDWHLKGLGFVILHRCGNDFYFLIINTWRGNNEVWETVFYKESETMADFALWPREGMHKPTFCVWELAPVWHEKESWERFLTSARDEAAAELWQRDLYAGVA